MSAVGFAGIGLAFLGAPQLLTRFMAARDRRQIGEGGVIAVLCNRGLRHRRRADRRGGTLPSFRGWPIRRRCCR